MPWSKNDLPPAAKNLKGKRLEIFIGAANAALKEYDDEGKAIATGLAAAKKYKEKAMDSDKFKEDLAAVIEKYFGGSSKEHKEIIKKYDDELKQATHIVYQPNVPDMHGEWMSEDTIRKACHSFNVHCRKANLFHKVETDKIDIVESYILPVDAMVGEMEVKKGTWIAVLQYKDDSLWEMEKSGELQGISIGARGRKQ